MLIIFLLALSSCDVNNSAQIADEGIIEAAAENTQNESSDSVLPNNLKPEFQPDLKKLHQASVYTINMEIELDGAIFRVEGFQEVVYTNQESVPLEDIYFRLFPNVGGDYLAVSNVQVNGNPIEPSMEFSNTALRLDLQEPLAPGESTTITVRIPLRGGV